MFYFYWKFFRNFSLFLSLSEKKKTNYKNRVFVCEYVYWPNNNDVCSSIRAFRPNTLHILTHSHCSPGKINSSNYFIDVRISHAQYSYPNALVYFVYFHFPICTTAAHAQLVFIFRIYIFCENKLRIQCNTGN